MEVTATGWRVITSPQVMFTRSSSMRALPTPTSGGTVALLWDVTNVPENERLLVLTWLLECLRPDTPYVVLELGGEQGSAKSTSQHYLRELIDPNQANNRAAPKVVEDLWVTARNAHLVSFENLSHLPPPYQDALCVLATGGGFAKRTLYTNADEVVLNLKRPIVLNGIAVVVTAQDLLDRTLHVPLPPIAGRMTASDLELRFGSTRPRLYGALLDMFVKVLTILPKIKPDATRLSRMADFCLLGEAVYRVHGQPAGAFLKAYEERRREGVQRTIEGSPVGEAILTFLELNSDGYDGTVKGLFTRLTTIRPIGEAWPKSPKGFADQLRRLAPALRLMGINAKIDEKPKMYGYMCVLKRRPLAKGRVDTESNNLPKQVHEVHEVHEGDEHHEHYEHRPGKNIDSDTGSGWDEGVEV